MYVLGIQYHYMFASCMMKEVKIRTTPSFQSLFTILKRGEASPSCRKLKYRKPASKIITKIIRLTSNLP